MIIGDDVADEDVMLLRNRVIRVVHRPFIHEVTPI
jgi:hypothetical protein